MLETLRRIIQEVNQAAGLDEALNIIVTRVKQNMLVDVCSVYLSNEGQRRHILMASDGLNPGSIGKVWLEFGQGLISLVAERAEPVNLEDAPSHPRFFFLAQTKENPFHAFLGVPIMHHRKVLGVLVVQQRAMRRFLEDETAFLLTIAAQLAGAIAHAEISGGISGLLGKFSDGISLKGLPGSPGVAIGTALVVYPAADLDAVPDRQVPPADLEQEVEAFQEAVAQAQADIRTLQTRLKTALSSEDQALFDAYLQMLGSASIIDDVIGRIRKGSWASSALRDTIATHVRVFENMDDPYMRERAVDVKDLGRRILMCIQKGRHNPPPYPERTILVGHEITATMLAEAPVEQLVGVISSRGSSSSHVAILARALGIPAVVGVQDIPVARMDGRELIADGYNGLVYVAPSPQIRREYERLAQEEAVLEAGLAELCDLPAETPDGYRMPLYANTGLLSDVTPSLRSGAEGVGLYRTEFPFMIRDRFPSEDEQYRIYRKLIEDFAPRPVVLRTLDVGGDKALSYFPIVEDNPFLGWRGIRITLDHPELFLVQVRAMLRAGAGYDNTSILLPMICSIPELDESLFLIHQAYRELREECEKVTKPRVGVMIEVPSLVYQIDAVAQRADFLSVGSNDLTQYLLAVDRNNSSVANLYDSLSPAVIHAIKLVVEGAARHQRPVSVCGEMAGDPRAVLLLLGLGIESLSMSSSSVSRIKWVIRNIERSQAQALLAEVLTMETAKEIRAYLDDALIGAGLGGLVRAGGK
ncbi:MAG: phosphoenolpyruvate--protein phosphotransferase [Pseudomonadota bacterium]|nr:phosphoenolpyruvate--protein phosphotransferase [Pseudomonadota bacterium]